MNIDVLLNRDVYVMGANTNNIPAVQYGACKRWRDAWRERCIPSSYICVA